MHGFKRFKIDSLVDIFGDKLLGEYATREGEKLECKIKMNTQNGI